MPEVFFKNSQKKSNLTLTQRIEIERKCNRRLNWTDGGHWVGPGSGPNCFMKDELRNHISHTYTFATDQAATAWNLEWEKIIRYGGHIGTTGLTIATTMVLGGIPAIVIGSLAAITKDELQASIGYPRMARGWTYEYILTHHFKWSPHPWAQKGLNQIISTISRDHEGKIVSKKEQNSHYSFDELPDGLARTIAGAPSKKTTSSYRKE